MKVSAVGKQVPRFESKTPNLELHQTTEGEAVDQVPVSGIVQAVNVGMFFLRFVPICIPI
jgi:hypothetical protein